MLKWVLSSFLVLALGGMAYAGEIKGKVLDKDGKPAADVTVRLMKQQARGGGGGGAPPEALATATTDKDGAFTMTFEAAKVPDGAYNLTARVQQPRSSARQAVTIKDGKPDKDSYELKLQEGRGRGGRGGGAGGAGQ